MTEKGKEVKKVGKGFLHHLADLGLIKPELVGEAEEKKIVDTSIKTPVATVNVPAGAPVTTGGADYTVFQDLFTKALQEKGEPYFRLIASAKSLEAVIPDEKTRFNAAMVTCKLTKDQVIQSILGLTPVLMSETDAALETINSAGDAAITKVSSHLKTLDVTIADLNTKLATAQDDQKNAEAEIAADKQSLADTITNAKKASEDLASSLKVSQTKVEQYCS